MTVAESAEIREEDYAATMMAVQMLMLAAQATGLGTHVKSEAVMDDPRPSAGHRVESPRAVLRASAHQLCTTTRRCLSPFKTSSFLPSGDTS